MKLGDTLTDSITGFTGVAIARTEWLNGCVRWTLQSKELKDGKPIGPECFDEPQLRECDTRQRLQQNKRRNP